MKPLILLFCSGLLMALCFQTFIASAQWQLTGNTGTNPTINFVGTLDNKPLVFRVNNREVVRFKTGGKIDINNSALSVYMGKNAGLADATTSPRFNVYIGHEAGSLDGFSDLNVAIGYRAMYHTGTGSDNVAVGMQALANGLDSWYNTAIGSNALYANTVGVQNTATGYYALTNNINGYDNTATGNESLAHNTSGFDNTANGSYSLYLNRTGHDNVAIGFSTMNSDTSGSYNTAVGRSALVALQNGDHNVGIGNGVLGSTVSNSYNIGVGDSALYKYNDGAFADYMVALGYKSLFGNTSGFFNTGIGGFSLSTNTSGYENTGLGYASGVSSSNLHNATAIGYAATATASNQIMLGNSSVTTVRVYGAVIYPSDGRFKDNIKDNIPGLDFINALQPVTYNYNMHKMNKYIGVDEKTEAQRNSNFEQSVSEKEKRVYSGFIAQDVEKTAKNLGYDFSGVYKPQSDKDIYGLSYSDFVVPLVKAVQQLSKQNENLKKDYEATLLDLQQQINYLKTCIVNCNAQSSTTSNANVAAAAELEQNIPNPFSGNTVINYVLPKQYNNAQLIISDNAGKRIQQLTLSGYGKGNYTIAAGNLSAGVYSYALLIDGKQTGSYKMVVTK